MKKIKCAKQDFTYADLPATRRQLFFDCYKEQFSLILRIGLVCLLMFVPIILVWLMRDAYLTNALSALDEQTTESVAAIYLSANAVFGLAELVAFTLFFALFSGVAQIVRQLCWSEPVFFREDFKKGIRENIGSFALVGGAISLLKYLIYLMFDSDYFYVLLGFLFAVFVPIAAWILLQRLYYRLRLTQVIKNAVLYFINAFPQTLLLLVCTILPFWIVLSFVRLLILRYLLVVVLLLFYVVPIAMAWVLYACHTFDIWLNQRAHSEIYRKGLRSQDVDIKRNKRG